MKLLLDQNLPQKLRRELVGHEIVTAAYMGWSEIENGELLRMAAAAGFDALLTNDRGIEYEQNLNDLATAVLIILAKSNTIEAIRPLYPKLLAALDRLQPRELVNVSA